ncbi:hypothetical protein ACFE04_027806 [Oxalis oulophora]
MGRRHFNFIHVLFYTFLDMHRALFPPRVPRRIRNRVHNYASLETPTGLSWVVEVATAAGGRLKFCGYGWMDFVEHHSVRQGWSLMFTYAGGSKFRVKIFKSNGAEIFYPSALVKMNVVQNNGIASSSSKTRSTIIECGMSNHGVAYFNKHLTESAVTGKQPVAFPASFLRDNKLLLNKNYKTCIVHIPVGAPVRSGLSWNYSNNQWQCSLLGGWKSFCQQCQPKKGDVVSIFLDFDEKENIPLVRISFVDREFDFTRQVKTELFN